MFATLSQQKQTPFPRRLLEQQWYFFLCAVFLTLQSNNLLLRRCLFVFSLFPSEMPSGNIQFCKCWDQPGSCSSLAGRGSMVTWWPLPLALRAIPGNDSNVQALANRLPGMAEGKWVGLLAWHVIAAAVNIVLPPGYTTGHLVCIGSSAESFKDER